MESFFLNPGLVLLGLPILAAPIVIHLINLMRHRRVDWAAMEFVLAAHKKSNTWVILKQLLLLLLRILIIAALILILAQLLLKDQWKLLVGGITTHHVVLLDDSYSMSDTFGDKTALERGKQAIARIGERAANASSRQTFTLLRFSRPSEPEINSALVDRDFGLRLGSTLERIDPSQTDAGPRRALDGLFDLFDEEREEKRIVYLVSDFRAREWEQPGDVDQRLERLEEQEAEIHLVRCVQQRRPNLAIVDLKPRPGTLAAGVPLFLEVSVRNFGQGDAETRRNVSVLLLEDDQARPSVVFDSIEPGHTETRRFQVLFPTQGFHTVTARLEEDAVEADNSRSLVLNLPAEAPVLIVDGDADASDGRYLNFVFNPSEQANTGLKPHIEPPRFLGANPLEKFHAIYLCNFERLDPPSIEALERYAANGGGVAFFAGERFNAPWINENLYRGGEGVFPLPLAAEFDLIVDRLDEAPDMEPDTEHPVFEVFEFRRNDFLQKVNFFRYFAADRDWQPGADSTVEIPARLRNGAPLAVEKRFGEGRVVAILSTAAPVWNNWAANPSFVVALHQLQAHLSQSQGRAPSRVVETPIELRLDPTRYQERWSLTTPAGETLSGQAERAEDALTLAFDETGAAGVYALELRTRDNETQPHVWAYNVVAEEGDLALVTADGLKQSLRAPVRIEQAESVSGAGDQVAQSSVSELLLYVLIFVLIGEQLLAYSASYHTKS